MTVWPGVAARLLISASVLVVSNKAAVGLGGGVHEHAVGDVAALAIWLTPDGIGLTTVTVYFVVEDDPALMAKLMPEGYKAKGEQAIVFTMEAWDANCPQHIPQRFEAADVAEAIRERDRRIDALEAEVEQLRKRVNSAKA